jgi:hypothetical protein
METERLCHTTQGVGLMLGSSDTEFRLVSILGVCKLRRQAYFLRQREAIFPETSVIMATPGCILPAPGPRI